VPSIYNRFKFVDEHDRELARLKDVILEIVPGLESKASLEVKTLRFPCLWFRSGSRSVRLDFYGRNVLPDVEFHWDHSVLFSFQTDNESGLSAVLKRWLCDGAMPSAMRQEFPWIKIDELADFYEAGNPVEGEFFCSWNRIGDFYTNLVFPCKARAVLFIAQLRTAGYDRKIRAGQSLWMLVLSRSRRHGLRPDQACVRFEFSPHEDAMIVEVKHGDERSRLPSPIALSETVREALDRLLACPVD
jgi:hypothetical protein